MDIYFSIIISAIALIVSVVVFIFDRIKYLRSLRKDLTDTIEKIVNVSLEANKIIFNYSRNSSKEDYEKSESIDKNLNSQRTYLTRHAIYLIAKIPKSVIANDYRILADAFGKIGDNINQLEYYRKALQICNSEFEEVLIKRGLAKSLIKNNQISEGRMLYEEIILKYENGKIHENSNYTSLTHWASIELTYTDGKYLPEIIKKIEELINNSYNYGKNIGRLKKLENIKMKYNEKMKVINK